MVGPLVMGAGHKAMRFRGQAKTHAERRKTLAEADAKAGFALMGWRRVRSPVRIHKTAMEFHRYGGVPND